MHVSENENQQLKQHQNTEKFLKSLLEYRNSLLIIRITYMTYRPEKLKIYCDVYTAELLTYTYKLLIL